MLFLVAQSRKISQSYTSQNSHKIKLFPGSHSSLPVEIALKVILSSPHRETITLIYQSKKFSNKQSYTQLMCFQRPSDPRFSFLKSFKLNLEERHFACGFKCTPRN